MNSYKTGVWAETLAKMFLRTKGYRILHSNYIVGRGTNAGEIDFIATRGNTIVFVEVKKRKDLDTAAYSILPKQQQRIFRAAEAFLGKSPEYQNYDCRFDAILVELPIKIRHIENAWTAN